MTVKWEMCITPNFYTVKLGCSGVDILLIFLLKNIDCGYLFELPGQYCSNEYPQSIFWANLRKENHKISNEKILISTAVKCVFPGHIIHTKKKISNDLLLHVLQNLRILNGIFIPEINF